MFPWPGEVVDIRQRTTALSKHGDQNGLIDNLLYISVAHKTEWVKCIIQRALMRDLYFAGNCANPGKFLVWDIVERLALDLEGSQGMPLDANRAAKINNLGHLEQTPRLIYVLRLINGHTVSTQSTSMKLPIHLSTNRWVSSPIKYFSKELAQRRHVPHLRTCSY